MLIPHLLRGGKERLRLPQIDDDVAPLHAQHFAGDDIALPAGVLLIDHLALRLPEPL